MNPLATARRATRTGGWIAAVLTWLVVAGAAEPAPQAVIAGAARKVVKLYGAGGLRGLEAHQSGILVSPDGRVSHFPRAMCRVTTSDGRSGLAWVEWNRNSQAG